MSANKKPATKAERVHALVNDGPYPSMSEAFDAHMGAACWTDRDYAQDAATWAAAWKAALSQAPSVTPSNQAGDVRYQCRAREIESRFWGDWVACSPAEAAEYLRTPVVGDIEYGVRTLPSAQEMSQFLTDVVTAAGLLAHGKRDKVLADRIGAAAFKLRTENLSPSVTCRKPVEPIVWATHHDEPMLFPTREEAALHCDEGEEPIPLVDGRTEGKQP